MPSRQVRLDDERTLATERHHTGVPVRVASPAARTPEGPSPTRAASLGVRGQQRATAPRSGHEQPREPREDGCRVEDARDVDGDGRLHRHDDGLDRHPRCLHQHAPRIWQRVQQRRARTRSRSTRPFAPSPTSDLVLALVSTTISATPVGRRRHTRTCGGGPPLRRGARPAPRGRCRRHRPRRPASRPRPPAPPPRPRSHLFRHRAGPREGRRFRPRRWVAGPR